MNSTTRLIPVLTPLLLGVSGSLGAIAQPITPALDGTGTQVTTPTPGQFDITGGTVSGRNLFHSFQQFGLDAQQTATFWATPGIDQILGRVVGGEASIIHGTLQVRSLAGATPSLTLMNPAGILFGASARLDVPAAFTATTASRIGFGPLGQEAWFSTTATPDYRLLTGQPTSFAFPTLAPGPIFNAGTLGVAAGQRLTLLGGTVINTGTLTAPGGQITIAAIPGSQHVRISETGHLLSLDLPLAALLTGGRLTGATGVSVTNGIITLSSTQTPIPTASGTTIVSGTVRATATPGSIAPGPVHPPEITILGKQIALLNATLDASGPVGGRIRVGGDFQGQGSLPRAQFTVADRQTNLTADALPSPGPDPHPTAIAGAHGGTIILWSDDTTRVASQISARGHNGGLVETSGKRALDVTGARVDAGAIDAAVGQPGTWLLDPGNLTISNAPTTTTVDTFPLFTSGALDANVNAGDIAATLNAGTSVTLSTAGADPGFGDITLATSITKTATNPASLTLVGRRFSRGSDATINLPNGGNLVFDLNQVNPEAIAPMASVQAAIDAIGSVAGERTINLGTGTYGGATLAINRSVTIDGGVNSILSGEGLRRVVTVGAGTTVLLQDLTITQGFTGAGESGAGIFNRGELRIERSTISNNQAGLDGGGIESADPGAQLVIQNSTLSGNRAAVDGGALFAGQTVTLRNTTLRDNAAGLYGGAIYNAGRLAVENATLINNQANEGGGIFTVGAAGLVDTRVVENQAAGQGGGLRATEQGTFQIDRSTIANNRAGGNGGGIDTNSLVSNAVIRNSATIANSTLSGNQAGNDGGGISLGLNDRVRLTNVTISGNQANRHGGGINAFGEILLDNSTITNNVADAGGQGLGNGGGIFQQPLAVGRVLSLQNSIVAGNFASGSTTVGGMGSAVHPDVSGTFVDRGNNLIGIVSGEAGFTTSLLVGSVAAPLNPGLAPLGNTGGPTQTHALLPTSPAINAGNNANAPNLDQRGLPRIVQNLIDIGAVEFFANPVPDPIPDPVPNPVPAPIPVPMPGTIPDRTLSPMPVAFPETMPEPLVELVNSSVQGRDGVRRPGAELPPETREASSIDQAITALDDAFSQDYAAYYGAGLQGGDRELSATSIQQTLAEAERKKGVRSAVIYAIFVPTVITPTPVTSPSQLTSSGMASTLWRARQPRPDDRLDLLVVLPTGQLLRRSVNTTRAEVTQQVTLFRLAASDPEDNQSYTALARQMYDWFLRPIEPDLRTAQVTSLLYSLDTGLRTMPLAAMHDATGFVIERYPVTVIPSMALTPRQITTFQQPNLLAMGADRFRALPPLPAVPAELGNIQQILGIGAPFLNQQFTHEQLLAQRSQLNPNSLHLATHAQFQPGHPSQSYIQLWDSQITLDQVKALNWGAQLGQPPLELLVLSACATAVGNVEAELGFAGFAAATGVRTVLGSLWQVSDVSTMALMSEFYGQLRTAPTRAQALQQAQLNLLRGTVRIVDNTLITSQGEFPLPPALLSRVKSDDESVALDFKHPFYWSAFTMVGNPW
jgi:filamentous hemagglutinin family protein